MCYGIGAIGLAMLAAGPALAQSGNSYTGFHTESASRFAPPGVAGDIRQIDDGISDGRNSGQLTHKQAKALRRDGRRIEAMQARAEAAGMTAADQAQLERSADALRDQVIAARTLPAATGD
jgi:hypothetical protein